MLDLKVKRISTGSSIQGGSVVQWKMQDESDRCSASLTGNKSGQDVDVTNVGTCEPN
jgi:hypothetical protein